MKTDPSQQALARKKTNHGDQAFFKDGGKVKEGLKRKGDSVPFMVRQKGRGK